MTEIERITIKCGHCGTEFKSGISFGNTESLHSSFTAGNIQECPNCGKMVGADKDNYDYRMVGGVGGGRGDNYSNNVGPQDVHPEPQDVFAEARKKLAEFRKKNSKKGR